MTTRYRGTTVVVNVRTPIRRLRRAAARRGGPGAARGRIAGPTARRRSPPQALGVAHHRQHRERAEQDHVPAAVVGEQLAQQEEDDACPRSAPPACRCRRSTTMKIVYAVQLMEKAASGRDAEQVEIDERAGRPRAEGGEQVHGELGAEHVDAEALRRRLAVAHGHEARAPGRERRYEVDGDDGGHADDDGDRVRDQLPRLAGQREHRLQRAPGAAAERAGVGDRAAGRPRPRPTCPPRSTRPGSGTPAPPSAARGPPPPGRPAAPPGTGSRRDRRPARSARSRRAPRRPAGRSRRGRRSRRAGSTSGRGPAAR